MPAAGSARTPDAKRRAAGWIYREVDEEDMYFASS